MPDDPAKIERALAENKRRRSAAKREQTAAMKALRALLVRGRAAGLTVAAMARTAAISRETAHKLLREAKEKTDG